MSKAICVFVLKKPNSEGWIWSPGVGGHWPRKGVWGCAAVMTPFFQASRRSLAYHFTIIAPLFCPHFQILENFSIFSLVLVKISALKTQILQKTPHFSRKIRSLDPTFGNLCGTYPPKKKKLSAPPPGSEDNWKPIKYKCMWCAVINHIYYVSYIICKRMFTFEFQLSSYRQKYQLFTKLAQIRYTHTNNIFEK